MPLCHEWNSSFETAASFYQTTFTLDSVTITDSSTGFVLECPHASIVLAIVVGASTGC